MEKRTKVIEENNQLEGDINDISEENKILE